MTKKLKIGLIPAAGKGTRIINHLNLIKSMILLKNRPILEYVIRQMKKTGIEHIYIIVGYQKEKIIKYFGTGKKWGLKISYLVQKNLNGGLGYAMGLAKKHIHQPFLIILGDDITLASLNNLIKQFFKHEIILAEAYVHESNKKILKDTCCLELRKNGLIKKIVEKPQKPFSSYRGCGIYVAQPEIFKYINETPPIKERGVDFTRTIDLLARENKALAVKLDGKNININTQKDLARARELLKTKKI